MSINILVAFIGLCLGSFANVLIYRIPRGLSILRPSSACPDCKCPIKWYNNIPILSYVIIRGKCVDCGGKISIQYPVVEFLTSLLLVVLLFKFQNFQLFIINGIFIFFLIVIFFIDLNHYIIPDILSIPLIFIGLFVSPINSSLGNSFISRFAEAFMGIIIGLLIFIILGYLGKLVFKKEALGFGDVKLMAAIGAFIGWKNLFISLFWGSLFGGIVAIFLIYVVKNKKWGDYIPYGPFLALGTFISILTN